MGLKKIRYEAHWRQIQGQMDNVQFGYLQIKITWGSWNSKLPI